MVAGSEKESDDYTLPKFKGKGSKEYNLWRFRLKVILTGKQYCDAIKNKDCPKDVLQRAEAIIVSGLGDTALRA